MKKLTVFFTAVLCTVLLLLPSVSASAYSGYDSSYYIRDYDVNIDVQENNSLLVTETITAHFNREKHGIYRYIPLRNKVKRTDGSSGTVRAKVKNLKVNNKYSTSVENSDYVIKIGDEDVTLLGDQTYIISYTYEMGKDIGEGYDELYYNIIGDGWDTYIEKASFKITMPKDFDEQKLGFSTGTYGTAGTDNILYTVDGKTITGSVPGGLNTYEALTVRLELEEGYFDFNYITYYISLGSMILFPLLALVTVFILWSKYGKDKKVISTVEFYPPENMNSLEVKLWHNGGIRSSDTVALLIELANEGYVKIHELDQNTRTHDKGDFLIEKTGYYTGSDESKRIFFNGLFETRNIVSFDDLKDKFYVHANSIVSKLCKSENIEKIFNGKSIKMCFAGWLTSIAGAVISFLIFIFLIAGSEKILCFGAGIIISVIAFALSFTIRQRTDKGHIMLQRISGFKNFLETAEKEKLEMMVEQNPSYYYDILPYAYTLGVSDKWTKKFEGIVMKQPDWYDGGAFSHYTMMHFINHSLREATGAMTSSPQSSSSGGGGFSGGGSGGGGGGSW